MAFASDIQLVRVTTDVMVDGIATKNFGRLRYGANSPSE
jgi:hypothetical protein